MQHSHLGKNHLNHPFHNQILHKLKVIWLSAAWIHNDLQEISNCYNFDLDKIRFTASFCLLKSMEFLLSLRFLSAFSRNFSASFPRKVGISLITIAIIVYSILLTIRNYNLRSAMSITLIQINVYLSLTHEITNFDMNPVSIITNFDMFLVISEN